MHLLRVATATVIAATALTSCTSPDSRFAVINGTDKTISRAAIAVCGQQIEMRAIPAGGRAVGKYRVKADCDYDISIQFADGNQLHAKQSYITNGVRYSDEIEISSGAISVKSIPVIG